MSNIYKNFRNYKRDVASFNTLNKRFDQPTYLSFRLEFGQNGDFFYNGTGVGTSFSINYDRMPHPLFSPKQDTNIDNRESYSSIDYLLDANEFTRAKMLEQFIEKFNKLQSDLQYYFQKIEGVDSLLEMNPLNGMRISSDKRLTITALEGLDLRITHLMQLYRKIAWDDVYQRWVLPDMMRYFTLNIYIAEWRTFHSPDNYDGFGNPISIEKEDPTELYLNILDDIIPVWVIKCEMCEFDLENIEFGYLSDLGVDDVPEEAGVKFQIKVGKIYEEQVYPVFQNQYLIDKQLNGFNRSKETDIDINENEIEYDSTRESNTDNWKYSGRTPIAQSHPRTEGYYEQALKLFSSDVHRSTASYNEMQNSIKMFGANAAGSDGQLFTEDDNIANFDPTNPDTWVGNALDFGAAYGKNFLESAVDKAKVTSIPGLGVSFNEVQSALESKNIVTALGLIRKGIDQVARGYIQPSELLEDTIDNKFEEYLNTVSKSEATSSLNQELQKAANIALNDDGTWNQIKDFSRATDLIGRNTGEVNSDNPIEGGTNYKNMIDEETSGDKSLATNLTGEGETNIDKNISNNMSTIIEGIPSSTATSNKLFKV